MRDRIPSEGKAGRVLLTPENGDAPFYAIMEMADDPIDVGTPPIKANLLTDEAETALFGSPADRTVNDAFLGISAQLKLIMSDMASITVTVKDHAGNPVKNVLVSSVYSESGSAVYTNNSGVATGYIAEGSQTISVKGYADLSDVSKTITVVKGSTVTEALTPTRTNFVKVTSSKSIKFSGNVSTIDSSVVGGGAAGQSAVASGNDALSGAGGSGGNVVTTDGIAVKPNTSYAIVIGAGGKAGATATGGGTSSAFGMTATGGSAGSEGVIGGTDASTTLSSAGAGNGIGGKGVNGRRQAAVAGNAGGNGKVPAYISFTETALLGAGGGSGGTGQQDGGDGGTEGGGAGGSGVSGSGNVGANATANTGSGGGGGGGYVYFSDDWNAYGGTGGNGAAGVVTARIHFDFGDLAA